MLFEENLLLLFRSSQSQSCLIYSQSKVKAKLIYIQILLFAIAFCHLSQPVCYHPYSVCKTVSVFLYFVCLQCRLALEHLLFALFDRVYVIFYTSFELFYLASLTQLCIIRHWDLLFSHNDTFIELFTVYRFYPLKKSSDFCAWSDIWNRYISTIKCRY